MNRAILGSVIVGIAVMMSMNMMPANAVSPDNVCVQNFKSAKVVCRILPMDNQHVVLVLQQKEDASGCHFNLSTFDTILWRFTLDHGGPEGCLSFFDILKEDVSVRGP